MNRLWFRLLLFGLGCVLVATSLLARSRPAEIPEPGRLIPVDSLKVWRSSDKSASSARVRVESKFEVVNRGGTPVRIISVEAGCGCTTPRIDPSVIEPGGSGFVTIEAIPFPVGEKTVPITLHTNSVVTPTVQLALRMIGSRRPPFLLQVVGDLTYLGADSWKEPREIKVITVEGEHETKPPVPSSDIPGFRFELADVSEKPYTVPNVVQRVYRFQVSFFPAVPEESFSGAVWIADPWQPEYRERLQVHGQTQPAFQIVPSRIILRHEVPASANFLVLTREPAPELVVEPKGKGIGALTVEKLGPSKEGRYSSFRVALLPDVQATAEEYEIALRPSPTADAILTAKVVVEQESR